MTTVAPLGDTTFLPSNASTKTTAELLYKSSGAIVAAIVIFVIVVFTVVLVLLKMHNRKMRTKRELEPKSGKAACPPALGPGSGSAGQPTALTFVPVDIHMENR
ncbi:noncompact myelin-associated protein [Tachyglossus aculeatus]|uniref:noncompact myelin-associated protein n=1 Tax=Tachyglossus aculeatus TaxID=9261 RepID=UPI0018F5BEAD|nr:noncompact myelin-associated protein [Tachyglossus aculeatus]XP_038614266.1 noncompact myelin-associated protein [Tachyglossus aculeatus]XP_038614267.1 noncompact myelin-associated protein [Tachyglossus aculeatus]